DFRLPELGEGVYEAELVAWQVKAGDAVRRGQTLMEVLTDKATMEVPAPFAGVIDALGAEPGQVIKVGETVLSYTPADGKDGPAREDRNHRGEKNDAPAKRAAETAAAPTPAHVLARSSTAALGAKAAPSVRYMARKLGVDLARIRGSGPGGRILIDDLAPHFQAGAPAQRPSTEPALDVGKPGTRIKLHGIRRKIADHMVLAKKTIPHYTYVDECDVTDLVRLREALKETFAQQGVKLTLLAFFVKAVTAALKEVPIINSSLDDRAEEIIVHERYHIGVAVATAQGLLVPVVHDADKKDLGEIAREIERLSQEARAGKIRLEDLRGGTFTITSIGGVGGLFSTPVINHPEVAILGIGKVVRRPVFDAAGNVRPADMVYLSLSCDHRVVDGAIGAVFCNAVIRRLQNPAALLLPEKV
ncbi:MAG TPA: dihydrolipoamide acetyltransferase family protein, partial [Gemmataceae bacterium]|nr:dihydrolipoamide acetyltransferase family protein [Gemmataceae bacterium]